jgi:hypothetical protein
MLNTMIGASAFGLPSLLVAKKDHETRLAECQRVHPRGTVLISFPVFAEDLAAKLGLRSQVSLAGVLSGFSKQAKRLGIRIGDIYEVNTFWKGRKKERVLNVKEGFREVAKQNQWPFVPLLKERGPDAASTNDGRK